MKFSGTKIIVFAKEKNFTGINLIKDKYANDQSAAITIFPDKKAFLIIRNNDSGIVFIKSASIIKLSECSPEKSRTTIHGDPEIYTNIRCGMIILMS